MNQILFTSNNNKKNNYNYNKSDTTKIIKVFCIIIILIAAVIGSMKAYEFYKNRSQTKEAVTPDISIVAQGEKPENLTIIAACEDGIDYISYTWNNETENKINLNGSTTFERMIDIPKEANSVLDVEVVSKRGLTVKKQETFNENGDKEKPTIDSITIVDSKLQITVSDNNEIKDLKYQWENEDEVVIEPDENSKKTMQTQIDIKRGTAKLLITVTDTAGNEESISKVITGVNEPEITAIKYGNIVRITVSHDMGFKKIIYTVNNKVYTYDENYSKYSKDEKELQIDFPLVEGENKIEVQAYSLEKLSEDAEDTLENYSYKKYTGKCTYEP